jgi:hypothetical protein
MRESLRQVLFRSAAGLDLNFAGGVFSLNNTRTASPAAIPGWSFSRTDTNGTATALDLAGNVIQFPSRTNLLLQSQTFENAAWQAATGAGSSITRTANYAAAPDESLTATRIQYTSVNFALLQQARTVVSGQVYTVSVYARSLGSNVSLALGDDGIAPLMTINVTSSWQRFTVTLTANSTTLTTKINSGANADVLLWGAQLETGSTATAYIPTTTAAVTVVLPRITNRGILVEEARTNLFPRSTEFDNAIWLKTGVTVTANQIAAPDASTTADAFTEDTGLSTHRVLYGSSSVTSGTSYTLSAFVKASGRTWCALNFATGFSNERASFNLANGTLGTVTGGTATITALANSWYRVTLTATCILTTAAGATYLEWASADNTVIYTGSGALAGYWWGAQLELGAFATSPIITTGAAGTRGVDTAIITPVAFSQPFTIAAEWDLPLAASVAVQNIANWTNATGFSRRIRAGSSATAFQLSDDANVLDVNIAPAGATAAGIGRAALRAQTNNTAAALNSALLAEDTSCNIATMTVLRIGSNASFEPLNGYVRRIRVLPTAASDAQLQTLTAP